jgi:hypothetical protein
MATTDFENKILASTNKLMGKFGQYVAFLSKSTVLKDVGKPWLGAQESYTSNIVKGVTKTLDDKLLNFTDARVDNEDFEILVAGDKLSKVDSNDLLFLFNARITSSIAIPSSTLSTDTTINSNGIYSIDSSSGNIVLTLEQTNAINTVVLFSRISSDINTVTINTQAAQTINGASSYNLAYNEDIVGFIFDGSNYEILRRFKVYEPMIVSPGGNNLLYKIKVGA